MDLLWTMLWFFLWVAWIWLVVMIITDIFRSDDLSGWAKALWTLFVIVLPWLGILVYVIVRGDSMGRRRLEEAAAQERMTRQYIQSVSASDPASTADELAKLAELRESGVLTEEEFAAQKARLLVQS
jgi:hypothetical protein